MLYSIQKIVQSKYKGLVYNLEVEDDNSYVVENAILHNCEPSASYDIVFDREILNAMNTFEPEVDPLGFNTFYPYEETHFYASGHDVAGGLGLDSSTSVFIDFSSKPARVVATYASNTIKPENFGGEIKRQQDIYGGCVSAPENNIFTECILILKQQNANLFITQRDDKFIKENVATEWGWKTTGGNKGNMLLSLAVAVKNNLLEIPDENLVNELRAYTRNDLMDKSTDPRLTTRHFDILIACAIAWQMKDYQPVFFAKKPKAEPEINKPLNMGWVDQKNNMDNIIEETYLN